MAAHGRHNAYSSRALWINRHAIIQVIDLPTNSIPNQPETKEHTNAKKKKKAPTVTAGPTSTGSGKLITRRRIGWRKLLSLSFTVCLFHFGVLVHWLCKEITICRVPAPAPAPATPYTLPHSTSWPTFCLKHFFFLCVVCRGVNSTEVVYWNRSNDSRWVSGCVRDNVCTHQMGYGLSAVCPFSIRSPIVFIGD